MNKRVIEREDILKVSDCINKAIAHARTLQAVEKISLHELLFHLDCCAATAMRMQAESWLEVEDSPERREKSNSLDH
jgi:hypothetical protein